MTFNLIDERWIPVLRQSGARDEIAPWEITSEEDPPIRVASTRPDFDSALTQLLIGLVQTCAAPADAAQWRKALATPPSPEFLAERFASVRSAFHLDGECPRFFQDASLAGTELEPKGIESLLIDAPGDNTLKLNKDLFVKRGRVEAMGYPAVAMALCTLQMNAPSGGQGHRTSLRGGGPLTTLVRAPTLWQTVWLNVLTETRFHQLPGDPSRAELGAIFPWLGQPKWSPKGEETLPDEVHPAQHFWAMPRRVWVRFEPDERGTCDVSGKRDVPTASAYVTKNFGINYGGPFEHPLTPYRRPKPTDLPNPKKGSPEGLPYRDWPDLVFARKASGARPAAVLGAYHGDRRYESVRSVGLDVRLWATGYDMDNMKARAWLDEVAPLFTVEDDSARELLVDELARLVQASEEVRGEVIKRVKAALFRRPADKKAGDTGVWNRDFWSATQEAFFDAAHRLATPAGGQARDTVMEGFLEQLHRAAEQVFQRHTDLAGDFLHADVERVATAWNELKRYTHPRSAKLRKLLDLPVLESTKSKRSKASKKAAKKRTSKATGRKEKADALPG